MPKLKPITNLRQDRWQLNRRWITVAGIAAVIIAGFKLFSLTTGQTNPVDQGLTGLQGHLVHVFQATGTGIGSLRHVFRIPSLLRENSRLESEKEYLERQLAELELQISDDVRLEALRQQLGYTSNDFTPVAARVTARPYDLWLESVILNIGRDDDVQVGNLAVNERGVVGRISEVQASTCRLQLISSPQFRLGAVSIDYHEDGRQKGQVEGVVRGISNSQLEMDYPERTSISIGNKVFSRGQVLEPGTADNRPRGLFIGVVQEKILDNSGNPVKIVITPAANTAELGDVVVYTR